MSRAALKEILAEPTLARLIGAGAPVVVAQGDEPLLVWANGPAQTLFERHDLPRLGARLFGGADHGSRRLATLAAQPPAPARLERLRFTLKGQVETLTCLCWRVEGEAPMFVAAAVDAPAAGAENATLDAFELAAREEPPAFVPVEAEAAAPASSPLQRIAARLAQAFPASPLVRFLWRVDAAGRLAEIGESFVAVFGASAARLVGADFAQSAAEAGADPDARLAAALASRKTWSGLDLHWPVEGEPAAVPVSLGASPIFGPGGGFAGYRGFGGIRIDQVADDARPRPSVERPPLARPAVDNVVPLRPHRSANPPALRIAADSVELSAGERNAFSEIARVLKGQAEAEAASAAPPDQRTLSRVEPPEETRPVSAVAASPELDPETQNADSPLAALRLRDLIAPEPLPAPSSEPEPARTMAERDARALVDAAPIGLLVTRGEAVLHANRAMLDLAGCADLESASRAGLASFFPNVDPPTLATVDGAVSLTRADGAVVTIDAHATALEWGGAPASLLVARASNEAEVAQRLRASEMELRRREAEARELNAILDTAMDGIAVLDDEGRLVAINRSAEALFGYDQSELVGKPFTILFAQESHAAAQEYFAGLKQGGVASLLNDGREATGRARQGGAIPIFMTLGRVDAGAGRKFCALLRDLTQWKKAERELNEARRAAERASALKSDFLAKVSHEIRTPLNAILGFAEVIMEERLGPVGSERYKDYLKDIHASGGHVMSLVNDLLDLSKIEAGRLDLDFRSVDVNRVVEECVSLMQLQADRERVVMRLSLAQGLPTVMADERSLRQISLNLLSNAVKYNEPGGQVIVSTAVTDAGYAVIRIKDTGLGMSEVEVATALEPFRRVGSNRHKGGTGLGLPLTKALVEAIARAFRSKASRTRARWSRWPSPPRAC